MDIITSRVEVDPIGLSNWSSVAVEDDVVVVVVVDVTMAEAVLVVVDELLVPKLMFLSFGF